MTSKFTNMKVQVRTSYLFVPQKCHFLHSVPLKSTRKYELRTLGRGEKWIYEIEIYN